jgi:hypothetical protein
LDRVGRWVGATIDPRSHASYMRQTGRTIRLTEGLLVIDVSSELTEAMRESRQASIRLREAVKSANLEQHRAAMKEMLAAWQRKRAAWLAMETPVPTSEEERAAPDTARHA